MIRKRIFAILCMTAVILASFGAGAVFAGSGSPGSSADPIVTKSYLDYRLADSGKTDTSKSSAASDTKVTARAGFEKITVKKGKTLILSAGSSAVIYRGSCTVTGKEGLILLSTGTLFSEGNSVVKYREYLSVASDSGLCMSGDTILFVSGDYKIK